MARQADHSRTQIIVALIGLAGVLAAALLTNWDKLFQKPPPEPADRTVAVRAQDRPELPIDSAENYSAAQQRALDASTAALDDVAAQIEAANAPPPAPNAASRRD